MKRSLYTLLVVLLGSLAMFGQSNWQFLSPVRNARFVYVTSYDGSQFSPSIWSQDRDAITTVQDGMRKLGYGVVYRPADADMIVAVESRGSEDVLAVYSPESWRDGGNYLWRAMGKHGLSAPDEPLLRQFAVALDNLKGKKIS